MVDLTTPGTSGDINGAKFEQISPQTTGTGVIDPFLRLKANGQEAAYNTSGTLANPFDQHGGSQYNRDLLLTSVPKVDGYYQFLLDINQIKNGNNQGNLLSLNQLQVFVTSSGGQSGGTVDDDGRLIDSGMSLVWDMNPDKPTANHVKLNYDLNPGSGAGDMFFYLPASLFTGTVGEYVVLYSQFGDLVDGRFASNAGFEEWAVLGTTVVAEPSTVVAGALLLIPFAASTLRVFRRNRA